MTKLKTTLYDEHDFERERELKALSTGHDLEREDYRKDWHRDYARVLHCYTFRRLQGKRQLFPYEEADFFRNRLTHSLEVAQIAKSIARRINATVPLFEGDNRIKLAIVETASLAHDLGHPPFGHNGEKALNSLLNAHGPALGYEGNAQTLRILAKLEHRSRLEQPKNGSVKVHANGIGDNGEDFRAGLNLTYRSLASVIKYDKLIKPTQNSSVIKGYYSSEADLVSKIKQKVTGIKDFDKHRSTLGTFKTIECSIMDIADDIAYSIFDLEDAFQAGFVTPIDLIRADTTLLGAITDFLNRKGKVIDQQKVYDVLFTFFQTFFSSDVEFARTLSEKKFISLEHAEIPSSGFFSYLTATFVEAAEKLVNNGYLRALTISGLIGYFIREIKVTPRPDCPALSSVTLNEHALDMIDVLKAFTFISLTLSPRLRYPEYRESQILGTIYEALTGSEEGIRLMTPSYQSLYNSVKGDFGKAKRTIADYMSGMTDKYALEIYDRLTTGRFSSIFRP